MTDNNKIVSNVSSWNNQVIPDDQLLKGVEEYTPKLCEEIVKQICQEKGLITSDPKVYRLIAIATQSFLEDLLTSTAESINCKKKNNKFLEFKELSEILKEKGVASNRTQFFCDNWNVNLDKPQK